MNWESEQAKWAPSLSLSGWEDPHNVIRHRVKRWSNVSLVGSFFVHPMMMNVRPPPPPSMLWLMRRHLITLCAQFMGFHKFYTFGTFEWQKCIISYIFYAESISYRKKSNMLTKMELYCVRFKLILSQIVLFALNQLITYGNQFKIFSGLLL